MILCGDSRQKITCQKIIATVGAPELQ